MRSDRRIGASAGQRPQRAWKSWKGLRGHTTGYGVPQYVIDAPGGGGKVPINPEYVLSGNADRVLIRNFEGQIFEYPEAPDGTPLSAPPKEIAEPQLV